MLEIIGVFGMLMILGAYFFISFDYVLADNAWYQLMNLSGGAAFIYYTIKKAAWASLALNVVWAFIAVFSLWKIFL